METNTTVPIRQIGKYDILIYNQFRLCIYTDGFTITRGVFIQLANGKHIWETNLEGIDVDRKIGRRTDNKIKSIILESIELINQKWASIRIINQTSGETK